MPKTKKYSLAYWVKKCMCAWTPEKDILLAVQTLIKIGSHPEIDFSGTPLELATALYLERFKRGTPWSGFFPTPAVAAAWAADLLPLNRGAVVLDPGCGFGSLSYAAQQRGAVPQMVEWSSAVVPIAQAIWGEAQVQYRDFLDGFRPTEFDAVLANPPFGNVFGHSDAAGDFLERIAELSRGGTYVSAILPRDYLSVERPKRRVEIAQRFTIIEKHDLNPDTFKPLTNIATTLYLLTVRRDGALVGEVRPRALARPESTAEGDQSIVVSCSAVSTETADESQSITADSDYQWKEPKFYPAIRGNQTVVVVARSVAEVDAEVQAGTCLLNSVGFDSRAKALDWLEHNTSTWQVDAGRDEAGNCLQCGEGGRCQCPHNRTAQSFQIDLDGDLIRADYHPDRAIGRDVCFDFHGPLVSATGYLTRFVARDTTLTLYEQAKAEVALAAAAWQQQRAKNFKTWPVKYAGDVAVRMADQVMRGCPISWTEHEQAWHIWLIREERAATVAADNVLENWATYFAAQLQPGDHIVYQPYPGQARLDADFVRVVPGEGWEAADDGHVEVKRRRDEKVQLARLSDLIGLWDELSPAERGESFSIPTFGLANTDPLEMTDSAFTAWATAIEQTTPHAVAGWRHVRAEKKAQGIASWPRLSDDRPRSELPTELRQWYAAHPAEILQHSTSTAYEAWGNDHLTIMQPKGEHGLPWTVCYAARIPSAQSAGEYVPLPLTPVMQSDDTGNVQGTTLFEALAALRDHLCAWQVDVSLALQLRGPGWTESALRELRAIVAAGSSVLIADEQLGLPTIHDLPHPEHMGYGTFRSVTDEYTVNWDAGGSMNRLSNGLGWTTVQVERGTFPYDTARLVRLLDDWIIEVSQTPRFVLTTLHVDTTKVEREFAEAAQSAQGKEPWQMTRAEFQATHRPISAGAQGRTLLDIVLAHGRDVQAGSDNVHISEKIRREAFAWLADLRQTLVQIALAELKPVPPEVLADYPDLAAKYPPDANDTTAPVAAVVDQPLPAKRKAIPVKPETTAKGNIPPAHWRHAAKFEFSLDGAPVVVEYAGANGIGFGHGDVSFTFRGPTISSTGYHSFFGKHADWSQHDNPEMYAIAVARRLVEEEAKELQKNRKTWPFTPPAAMQVVVDGGQQAALPISWNSFNQWWNVWLVDARQGCSITCKQIVGFDPSWLKTPAASGKTKAASRPTEYRIKQDSEHDQVEVQGWQQRRWETRMSFADRPAAIEWLTGNGINLSKVHGLTSEEREVATHRVGNPFDLDQAAFDDWAQTTNARPRLLWREAYRYFAEGLALSEAGWKFFAHHPLFVAKRQSMEPPLTGNPFAAPRDQFVRWVQARVTGTNEQAAYLQGYAAVSAGCDDILLPEARVYLATQPLYDEAWATRAAQPVSTETADVARAVNPAEAPLPVTPAGGAVVPALKAELKRPKHLPDDLPEIIEVDVGGRHPEWIGAAIVRVSGVGQAMKLIARRHDGRGEVKLPIYGRDINWRVPATAV